nr:hypothetical protein [Fodinicola feengrottensis]
MVAGEVWIVQPVQANRLDEGQPAPHGDPGGGVAGAKGGHDPALVGGQRLVIDGPDFLVHVDGRPVHQLETDFVVLRVVQICLKPGIQLQRQRQSRVGRGQPQQPLDLDLDDGHEEVLFRGEVVVEQAA